MITADEFEMVVTVIANATSSLGNTMDGTQVYAGFTLMDVLVGAAFLLSTWDFFWDYVSIVARSNTKEG